MKRVEDAIKVAERVLVRDPGFLDARAALVAFRWAMGGASNADKAEGIYSALMEAMDGVGADLYGRDVAVALVRNRWPPRATAALDAFLRVSRTGRAVDYDGETKVYEFGKTTSSNQLGDESGTRKRDEGVVKKTKRSEEERSRPSASSTMETTTEVGMEMKREMPTQMEVLEVEELERELEMEEDMDLDMTGGGLGQYYYEESSITNMDDFEAITEWKGNCERAGLC